MAKANGNGNGNGSKSGKRKHLDWEAIDPLIRANQLSVREIARQNDCNEKSIRNRIKSQGIKRNLSEQVRESVKENLVRNLVRTTDATDKQIVEAATERGVEIITLHRDSITKSQTIVELLQRQLYDAATTRDELEEAIIEDTKGEDGKPDLKRRNAMLKAISLPSHISSVRNLAMAQTSLVNLERQAYNLEDKPLEVDEIPSIPIEFVDAPERGDV